MHAFPRALFISHGGGSMPLLGDPGHREMVSCLQGIAASIPKPDAILVISAHWEEPLPVITSGSKPALIDRSTITTAFHQSHTRFNIRVPAIQRWMKQEGSITAFSSAQRCLRNVVAEHLQ